MIGQLSPVAPKVAALLADAEEDLLAFYRFPAAHWPKLRSTNNLERVNKEIARRPDVVGIFPQRPRVIRLVGALLIKQGDEWLLTRGYLSKESIALVLEEPGRRQRKRGGGPGAMRSAGESRYTWGLQLDPGSIRIGPGCGRRGCVSGEKRVLNQKRTESMFTKAPPPLAATTGANAWVIETRPR